MLSTFHSCTYYWKHKAFSMFLSVRFTPLASFGLLSTSPAGLFMWTRHALVVRTISWTTRYKTHINHNLSSRKNSCMGHGGEIHLREISCSFVCVRPFPGTPGSCDCGGHSEMTSSPWHVTRFWQYHLVFLHTPPFSLSLSKNTFSLTPAAPWIEPNASSYIDEWSLTPSSFCEPHQTPD